MLTLLRMWIPEGADKEIRGWARDRVDSVQLRRLFVLAEYGPLTEAEVADVRELGKVAELAYEVQMQLRKWE